MSSYDIRVFFSKEDGGYIADVPALKYCSAFGKTRDEAVRQVKIAMKAWLEAAKANNKPIPAPKRQAKILIPPMQVHVVPRGAQWAAVKKTEGKQVTRPTKEEAIRAAAKFAKGERIVVHDRRGRIESHIRVPLPGTKHKATPSKVK